MVDLPVVMNIDEARAYASSFPAVITAGPRRDELGWEHGNHCVRSFADRTTGRYAPSLGDVHSMLDFAYGKTVMIHCHRGESRSTAIAIGVAISAGWSAVNAVTALMSAHPVGRAFTPNTLIIEHIASLVRRPELSTLVQQMTDGVVSSRRW